MTAKQALMRAVDMVTKSFDTCVYDDNGYQHWVEFRTINGIDRLVLGCDSPSGHPFATDAEPYHLEDPINND